MKDFKSKKHINNPINSGNFANVPMIMQMEALECGAACIDMILAYYGRFESLSKIRKECGISRDGSNLDAMVSVAKSYGLECHSYQIDTDGIKNEITFPCILFWENNHYVVLDGYKNGKFRINNPACGVVTLNEKEFSNSFSGICTTFVPGEKFEPGGVRESIFGYLKSNLIGAFPMIALIFVVSLLLTLIGVIEPVFPRFFVDYLVTSNVSKSWNGIFFTGYIIIGIIQIIVLWIRNTYLLKMEGKMAIYSSTKYIWHILSLPMDFFSQRYSGDIINRCFSNEKIAATIIKNYTPILLDFISMIFYFIMIIVYSPLLSFIGIISVVINLILTANTSKISSNLMRIQMKNDAELSNAGINGIQMIETIKASGAEVGFFQKWAGLYANKNNGEVELNKISIIVSQIPALLSLITSGIILCMSVAFVIKGYWTIGLVSAFSLYFSKFTAPSSKLINSIKSYKELCTNVERIKDVMDYEEEKIQKENVENINYNKLSGKIEIKNISFGYNIYKEPLIKDFSLNIEPGDSIAFVGTSGSGKSTIARLLSNLNKVWSGEILYDGIKLDDIDRNIFVSSVSSVDQQISIFSDTIYNNITMWDESILEEKVVNAASDAEIYDDIMTCENGLQTMMTENGRNFSGGQRQRIEIARALSIEPTILIMDEATSALDSETEYKIVEKIKKKNITTIIISHRLSIVRDCKMIIVLKNGKVLDKGTHNELMDRCKYYSEMITNE